MTQKIFLSAFSKAKDWKKETAEIAGRMRRDLGDKSCDLLLFFVSEAYKDLDIQVFLDRITETLAPKVLIGCNAGGIICNEKEIEMQPAVGLMAMHLPGVRFYPFYISPEDGSALTDGASLIKLLDIYPNEKPKFLFLGEPSSFDITGLLSLFNEAYKGLPVVGGMASGNVMDVPNWLVLNGTRYAEGGVGVALVGDVEFETIVSQGCRPISKPFVITRAEDNVLYELAGRPALEVVQDVLTHLPAKDRKLAEHSLFIGLVMNEQRTEFRRGDFLIRNLVGFDPQTGSLSIGAHPKVGQTLQFQLRDAETSSEDLKAMLDKLKTLSHTSPHGAFLVSCCGRGQGLYGVSDFDSKLIQAAIGPIPMMGFFANGEIGPIGTKNYIHGYTSSLAVIK